MPTVHSPLQPWHGMVLPALQPCLAGWHRLTMHTPRCSIGVQGDSTWMQRLEEEQVAGAKGVAGMERR